VSYEVGGARSSDNAPAFHKIPAHALIRLAKRYSAGIKHEDQEKRDWAVVGGSQNWQSGDAEYATERFNHLMFHLLKWKQQYDTGVVDEDDNLAAALWGVVLLMDYEERGVLKPKCAVEPSSAPSSSVPPLTTSGTGSPRT
jgi:hypothetical protein